VPTNGSLARDAPLLADFAPDN